MSYEMIEIPIDKNDGNQEIDIVLNETLVKLDVIYNSRLDRWSLDIRKLDGTDLVTGIALVAGVDLFAPYVSNELPQGQLFCHNLTDFTESPNEDNIGETALLFFRYEE